jgi:hypothetical protein
MSNEEIIKALEERADDRSGSKSVIAVMSAPRPLFHRKRKSIRDLVMSQMCLP